MMKRFLIFILVIILSLGLVIGVVLSNNNENEKDNDIKLSLKPENTIEEIQNNEEEPINVILENDDVELEQTEEVKEDKTEDVVNQENLVEVKQEKKQVAGQFDMFNYKQVTTVSEKVQNNKQTSSNSNKNSGTDNNNLQTKTENKTIPQKEPVVTEQPKAETPKQEESKPVENKPVETQKQTTPVREYKVKQNYINKIRRTITTEVRNNLSQLNKYGITDVSQYKISEDSSICACYGGHRNGWTYENITAYNTFKSSILKGTSIRIYAVDEYYNGQYIQTLCYYGH